MKALERDTLLGRLDERSEAILAAQEETRDHLKTLNGKVADNCRDIAVHGEQLKVTNHRLIDLEKNGVPTRLTISKKQYAAGGGSILLVIATIILNLLQELPGG